MTTPRGERRGVLSLRTEGAALNGHQMDDGHAIEIFDGVVEGDTLSWKISVTVLNPFTVEFNGLLDGRPVEWHRKSRGVR